MMRQVLGPDFDPDPDKLIQLCVDAWFESSLSLDAMCRARDIPYLHVLQPTLYDDGAKPMSDDEKAMPLPAPEWIEGVRRGYPALRARGNELAGARSASSSTPRASSPDQQRDALLRRVPLRAEGHAVLADRIADQLLLDVVRAPSSEAR
jgi:hypothetical protein